MKIVITGSLGHVGKPLSSELVQKGNEVTVISSNQERKREIEEIGAEPAIGSISDIEFLTEAFSGADAVFLMNPPDFSKPDIREFYREATTGYAYAIKKTSVPRIVQLSSYGADLDSGTGIILGSHYAEEILKKVSEASLTVLRPGYFYYNLLHLIGMIKNTGEIKANYGTQSFPMVSPKDIAKVAAEELLKSQGDAIRYIGSSEHSGQEIASILGNAIGKPDLKWTIVSDDIIQKGMENTGRPKNVARLFTDMYSSIEDGRLTADYKKNRPSEMGKVKLEDFAVEFAKAYHKN